MGHDIAERDGRYLVAVNTSRGHPWHRLGESVDQDMSVEQALELVGVLHEEIRLIPLHWQDPPPSDDNDEAFPPDWFNYSQAPDVWGVYSNVFGYISAVGNRWHPLQRRTLLEQAYEIVGLSNGDAHIDTIGNLGEHGDTFFAYIQVPSFTIDPNGIADKIENGLYVATSYNSTLKNTIGYSPIRPVCRNTLTLGLGKMSQTIQAKHTKNAEERIQRAAEALGYIGAVEKKIIERAEQMLRVKGVDALEALKNHFWDVSDEGLGDKALSQRQKARSAVHRLYEGDTNVPLLGRNGWAAYNATVEYLDHERTVRGEADSRDLARARAAVLPGPVMDKKIEASEIVLSLN